MKILLICRRSRPQVLYEVVVLKNFAKFTRKHLRWSLFVGRSLKPTILLKKRLRTGGNLQNFEEHLFHRTAVGDCFWIYQKFNCRKVSVSKLIITKKYKEAGRIGRSKYSSLHPSFMKGALQQKSYLNHVIKSFTQLLIVHGFAQNINILILQNFP